MEYRSGQKNYYPDITLGLEFIDTGEAINPAISALTTFMVFSGILVAWSGGFLLIWLYAKP